MAALTTTLRAKRGPSKAAQRYVDQVWLYVNTWSHEALRQAIALAYDAGRRSRNRRKRK